MILKVVSSFFIFYQKKLSGSCLIFFALFKIKDPNIILSLEKLLAFVGHMLTHAEHPIHFL